MPGGSDYPTVTHPDFVDPTERDASNLDALRQRIGDGLDQARSGQLAAGSGEDAIRRAFTSARHAI